MCAVVGALAIALCVGACGSANSSSTATNAGAAAGRPGSGRRGFLQDPKVVACLKKAGRHHPERTPARQRRPTRRRAPPTGTDGQPPSGQGRQNRRPDSAQFQKLRAALQKCGVTFPGRPPNGQPPQGQGTTSTSAS